MKKPYISLITSLCVSTAAANIVVNGDFSSGMAGTYNASVFGGGNLGGTGIASGTNNIYDGGWVTYSSGGDYWTIGGSQADRATVTNFNFGGFGQFISNPYNGTFDNGDTVTFSFDYVYNGSGTAGGLAGAVYGVTAPNGTNATWNLFSGEGITSAGQAGSPTIDVDYTSGADYQFYVLDYIFDDTPSASIASYSNDVTLTRDYDLFVVLFQADRNSSSSALEVSVSDVSFAAIPEPQTYALILGLTTLIGLCYRRRQ